MTAMDQLWQEMEQFRQACDNDDNDEIIRYSQYFAKKFAFIADNALKRKKLMANAKLRPGQTYIGQRNKFRATIKQQASPMTDKKWADGNMPTVQEPMVEPPPEPLPAQPQEPAPPDNQWVAEFRRKYGIRDSNENDGSIDVDYTDYRYNETHKG